MNNSKNAMLEFVIGMGLYAVLLIAMLRLLPLSRWIPGRVLLAALPIVGVYIVLRSISRAIQGMDELQQRIQFEAAAFSLAGTGFLTFTFGLLENALVPPISLTWVLPMMAVLWGIGQLIATRRYK